MEIGLSTSDVKVICDKFQKFTFCLQVLVHGEHTEMGRLKAAIIREYEDKVGFFRRKFLVTMIYENRFH